MPVRPVWAGDGPLCLGRLSALITDIQRAAEEPETCRSLRLGPSGGYWVESGRSLF